MLVIPYCHPVDDLRINRWIHIQTIDKEAFPMEENKRTDQEAKELNLEKMEQVSGGADDQTGYFYCYFCQRETYWENGVCTEIHRRPIQDWLVPGQ